MTSNNNNDDIRCGLFKQVRVNCNYIRHLYEESRGKEFDIAEEYEDLFWYEYNVIVSNRSINDNLYEDHIIDDLEIHINECEWVTETNVEDSEEEDSEEEEVSEVVYKDVVSLYPVM